MGYPEDNPISNTRVHHVGKHHYDQFGHKTLANKGMKVGEECGELLGALVRYEEGRGGIDKVRAEMGDVIVTLCALCSHLDLSLSDIADDGIRAFLNREWPDITVQP